MNIQERLLNELRERDLLTQEIRARLPEITERQIMAGAQRLRRKRLIRWDGLKWGLR